MKPSEILDLMIKADRHLSPVRITVLNDEADKLISHGAALFKALIKDVCPAVESVKTIRDEAINGNIDFCSPFGEKIRQRLQRLDEDALQITGELVEVGNRVVYTDLFDSVHCLQMNLFAIMNNIRDIRIYATPTEGEGGQAEASKIVVDEEAEKELKALFEEDERSQRQANKFVDGLRSLSNSKSSNREYARASAYTHIKVYNFLRPTYRKWTLFWDMMQKILKIDCPGYKNKRQQLSNEYETKYKK